MNVLHEWTQSVAQSGKNRLSNAPKDIQLVDFGNCGQCTRTDDLDRRDSWTNSSRAVELSSSALRFYYFGDRHIYPLFDPGKGVVNSMLKSRFGQKRPLHKGVKRRNIPSLGANPADVLGVLSGRYMLPAIYFYFRAVAVKNQ